MIQGITTATHTLSCAIFRLWAPGSYVQDNAMGVLIAQDRRSWWAPQASTCFYCGRPLDESPAVFWCGEDGTSGIVLHPDCAVELGQGLICDSREALLAAGEADH